MRISSGQVADLSVWEGADILKRTLAALALSASAVWATTAHATNLITIDGSFSGTLNGVGFVSSPAAFTGISPGDPQSLGFGRSYAISSLTAKLSINGQPLSLTFSEPGFRLGVFANSFYGLGINADYLFNYDIFSNMVTVPSRRDFETDAGSFRITSGTIASTSIVAAAVPEPATWGMMLLGFGAMGFAMRSRRSQTVKVGYAAA